MTQDISYDAARKIAAGNGNNIIGHIYVVGGANIDIYGRADRQPEHDDSSLGTVSRHAGGVGRNIAENLGWLGLKPTLITAIGDDDDGIMISTGLTEAAVDMNRSITVPGQQTDTYLAIYDQHGDMIAAINNMCCVDMISPDDVMTALEDAQPQDIIVLDGNLGDETITTITAAHGDKRIIADAVSTSKATKFKPVLSQLHFMKCNRQEAATITGLPSAALAFDHCRALRDAGVRQVLISDGAAGAVIGTDDGYEHIPPAQDVTITNTSGAGDALLAGIIYGIMRGDEMTSAVKFAHQMAAITLNHDGPVVPHIMDKLTEMTGE